MALHWFNPENDLALACFSPHFIPPASARMMADELSALPVWWTSAGDTVAVASVSEARLLAGQAGGLCPEVEWVGRKDLPACSEVQPWGWSPLVVNRLLAGGVAAECLPDEAFLLRYRDWSGRRHAVDMLDYLVRRDSETARRWPEHLCGEACYCTSEQEVVRWVNLYPRTILKAPWSGSGKGLRLGYGRYESPLSGWCRRLLREQGGVVVEPLYDKVADFAMEFYVEGERGVRYVALSEFLTTARGTYAGNRVASEEAKMSRLTAVVPEALLECIKQSIICYLTRLFGGGYHGCLGIDMMLCRTGAGDRICVHPCVEINLRRTMGHVAASLGRFVAPSSEASFVIDYYKDEKMLRADHDGNLAACPPVISDGKLLRGYLPLIPVTGCGHYRAAMWAFSGEDDDGYARNK